MRDVDIKFIHIINIAIVVCNNSKNMKILIVELMPSKVILLMPKNQELSKFQRFKNQVLKNQVSRIKIQG